MAVASVELEAQMAGVNAASNDERYFLERHLQSTGGSGSACVEDAQLDEINHSPYAAS